MQFRRVIGKILENVNIFVQRADFGKFIKIKEE